MGGLKGIELNSKQLGINDNGEITIDGTPLTLGGASSTANNGLTKTGSNITLGGALTSDVLIDGNHHVRFGSVSHVGLFEVKATSLDLKSTASAKFYGGTLTQIGNGGSVVLSSMGNGARLTTQPNGTADLAIATTKYVDDKAGATAENGLNLTAGKVKLGGALTEHTEIECSTYNLSATNGSADGDYESHFNLTKTYFDCQANTNSGTGARGYFGTGSGSVVFNNANDSSAHGFYSSHHYAKLNSGTADKYGKVSVSDADDAGKVELFSKNGAQELSFTMEDSVMVAYGEGDFKGIQYGTNYGTKFLDSSLVDKQYVNGNYKQEQNQSTFELKPNEKKIFRIKLNQNANLTLNTSNISTGEWGTILAVQDATGNRALTFDNVFKKNGSTVNSTANKTTVIKYLVISMNEVLLDFAYSY